MDLNTITEIISNLGFPVAMVLYFIWDKYKVTSNLVQAINNNNKILSMLLTKLDLVEEGLENESNTFILYNSIVSILCYYTTNEK